MKLKSYILLTVMVCAIFSCSNDDVPGEKVVTPIVPEATLDLSVKMDAKMKMKAATLDGAPAPTWDFMVKRLTLVAFNAGAYTGNNYKKGQIVAVFDQKYDTPTDTATQTTGNALLTGETYFLLFANLTDAVQKELLALVQNGTGTSEAVLALAISLDDEKEENGLTMTFDLGELNVVAGKNYIGFATDKNATCGDGTEIYGKEVKLTRIISAINLEAVALGEKVTKPITIKQVFLANVKGAATLGGEAAYAAYWAGACECVTGIYKFGTATQKASLLSVIGEGGGTIEAAGGTLTAEIPPFLVYPNANAETGTTGENNYTLLVVEARHEIEDKPNTPYYYTVIVNDERFTNGTAMGSNSVDGKHIASNYKYTIHLTINGEGSYNPFDPKAYANVSAKITVADWNVVEINDTPLD